jgi:dihydrofolate reductase
VSGTKFALSGYVERSAVPHRPPPVMHHPDVGKLVYTMNVSLDGYVEDAAGSLEWTRVDDELHRWFNEDVRRSDGFLYGRRLYETMAAHWPTAESDPAATEVMLEFARIWLSKPKVVFSSTLESVDWNSRLVRGDPVEELPRLHEEFHGELGVAGPTLAAAFVERGLVDEYRLLVHPVILGGGKPYWPRHERRQDPELIEERRFGSGVVLLAYSRVR